MAFHPLSWLLGLAVLCHLVLLLTGQHHGVSKCKDTCNAMTSKIPVERLVSYRRMEASCGKPAIILTTKKNRTFCADPKEKWVQEAMKYLKRIGSTVAPAPFYAKWIKPTVAPASRGMDLSLASEPTATEESSGQEVHRASGTSPEPPRSPSISLAPDGVPSGGPERTELFNVTAATTATTTAAATTTATSWQSSYQPTVDLWAEGKASKAASTQAPSTQAPSTQAPSTQTSSTQAPSTQAPSTQAPSSQTPSTQAPFTQALPTQTGSIQTPPTDTASTQAPSPQAPTISHTAPDPRQDLTPENPLGSSSAHTDAVTGPHSRPHVSVAPSREPVSSGSWAPTPKDPQRLGILTTPITYPEATRRQAVGLLAFLGLLFCLGVAMFTYQRLQGCPRRAVGDMVEGLRYVPRSCGSNSYVLVPV